MPTINWGLLQKSAVDNSTIEDVINALILAHNNDPTAHLGDGQSLQSHKASVIIDHLIGSVVADKKTMTQLFFQTQFENPSVFYTYHSPTFKFPGFALAVSATGNTNSCAVDLDGEPTSLQFNFSKDFLFQFSFFMLETPFGHFQGQMGYAEDISHRTGVGLTIDNATAKFYVANKDGTHLIYLAWPSFSPDNYYIVRMQFSSTTGLVSVYIDGDLLGTLVPNDLITNDVLLIDFNYYEDTLLGESINIYDMTFSQTP